MRRRRYTKKDLAIDALIVVFWIGMLLLVLGVGLHVWAAPADVRIRDGVRTGREYAELLTIDRAELADMRAAEEWTEPVVYENHTSETETAANRVTDSYEVAAVAVPEAELQTEAVAELTTNRGQFTERERYLLLHIMVHEAGNQGVIGQALVGRVVLNRVESSRFPGSIEAVLFQPGQFGPEAEICRYEPNADSYAALELLEQGWDESQGAFFFESGAGFSWATFLFQYGGHRFYTV